MRARTWSRARRKRFFIIDASTGSTHSPATHSTSTPPAWRFNIAGMPPEMLGSAALSPTYTLQRYEQSGQGIHLPLYSTCTQTFRVSRAKLPAR